MQAATWLPRRDLSRIRRSRWLEGDKRFDFVARTQGSVEAKVSALAVDDDDARTNPLDELIVGSLRRCVVCHPTRNPLFGELVERFGRELAVGERPAICWIGVV